MRDRPSWPFLATAFGATLLLFVLAYWRSFQILPAGDDFGYIIEIHRGNHEGVLRLFTRSVSAMTYRPMASVGTWAFGRLFPEQPHVGIRVLHLLSAVLFALVALPWIRLLRLDRVGSVVVIALMLLHPVFPQAAGSIDGFNSLVSSAFLWLGSYVLIVWRDRPVPALLAATASFVAGALFKEYTFGLVPLAMLTIACFWRRNRPLNTILAGLVLGLLLMLAIWVRRFTISPEEGHAGWGYVALNPLELLGNVVTNAAVLASGILFFGNSVWVFVNRSPAVLAMTAAVMLLVVAMVSAGLRLRWRQRRTLTRAQPPGDPEADPLESLGVWLAFLMLSFGAASFPVNVMTHVSEMYVPPIVFPFALLCGLAADGWMSTRPGGRALAAAFATALLVSSILTIRAKVEGLIDVGRRADNQLQQILSHLPPDAENKTIAIRYLAADRKPRDLYAVFRMPDHLLLVHHYVFQWPRPYRGLVLDCETVSSFDEVDPSQYDLTLGWDAQRQMFLPIK